MQLEISKKRWAQHSVRAEVARQVLEIVHPMEAAKVHSLDEFERAFHSNMYFVTGGYGGMDRDSRPPRPDVPFPTQPPWTAFIGNMSFECTADEVKDFFSAENITANNVRLVTEFGGKSKGFCYAEFPEAEMLRSALALSGAQLGGRTVRISVAEARE